MTKKHFIALADAIRDHNGYSERCGDGPAFTEHHLDTLAGFLRDQNPAFNQDRWMGYIKGINGPNGGAVK
jgi:hypothetical protein